MNDNHAEVPSQLIDDTKITVPMTEGEVTIKTDRPLDPARANYMLDIAKFKLLQLCKAI